MKISLPEIVTNLKPGMADKSRFDELVAYTKITRPWWWWLFPFLYITRAEKQLAFVSLWLANVSHCLIASQLTSTQGNNDNADDANNPSVH